jgi:hypothetical protein
VLHATQFRPRGKPYSLYLLKADQADRTLITGGDLSSIH